MNGVPNQIVISERQIPRAWPKSVGSIIEGRQGDASSTPPPKLVADIVDKGIMLTGGGRASRRSLRRASMKGAANRAPTSDVFPPLRRKRNFADGETLMNVISLP